MFCQQLKYCLSVPAGASSAGLWLIIIYSKWHYDSNYFGIKLSYVDIPPACYSKSSGKSAFSTTPQTIRQNK